MTSPAGTEDGENAKQFSVNWSNHMNHVRSAFDSLLTARELVDVTLYCEGQKIGAHKMLLSACSSYFREIFKDIPCQHPVIILKGVQFQVLQDILKFIYSGEVSIDSQNFDAFLKTAQLLQVSGLTESNNTVTTPLEQQSGSQSDTGNTKNKTNNNQPIVKKEHTPTKHKTNSCVKELPVKRKRESTESGGTSPVQTIKCEPGELTPFEENLMDPLYPGDQEIDPDIDDTFLTLPGHSLQDYKDESTKYVLKARSQARNIQRSLCTGISEKEETIKKETPQAEQSTSYGRCKYCDKRKNRRTKYFCKNCHKYMCLEHICVMCPECYEKNTDD